MTPVIAGNAENPRTLITENTAIVAPRLVPEISLHLADEDLPLYRAGEDELTALGIGTPYWAFAWAGGQALARYVLDNPDVVAGKRVLDFGAGSGLVAIAAAKAGAAEIIAADIDPVAAEAMSLNGALNGVDFSITTEDLIDTDGGWDPMLIGDVCYDKEIADRLLPWLRGLAAVGRTVLIGDPGRFILRDMGLETIAAYHAETTGIMEDSDLRNARVWRFSG
ncbi:MAG: 50S ribosomal protein L11 methyltransferase [Rhodospirillaceae bacterium]|nr:50S ribosomal protein L11 methyltransferase [Rhodospirillaceae bacterium]